MQFLAISLALLAAAPSALATGWTMWGVFYNNADCSDNGGHPVAADNNGCLNEAGRKGLGLPAGQWGLCTYTQGNCAGGAAGAPWFFDGGAFGYCVPLQTAGAVSYRFIGKGQSCP